MAKLHLPLGKITSLCKLSYGLVILNELKKISKCVFAGDENNRGKPRKLKPQHRFVMGAGKKSIGVDFNPDLGSTFFFFFLSFFSGVGKGYSAYCITTPKPSGKDATGQSCLICCSTVLPLV